MRKSLSSFGALLCTAFVAIAFSSAAKDTLDTWRWRNPLPSGGTRGSIAFLNNQFVVITAGPGLLTSPDGTNWTDHAVFVGGTLNQITYGNGRYVAVGSGTNAGLTATSTDLANWTTNAPGTPYPIRAVAFGGGVFAAVGSIGSVPSNNYAGYLITSTDGQNWTLRASPSNSPITDIVYGAGKFVALTESIGGPVLVSDDGTNWVSSLIKSNYSYNALSFADGNFYASGSSFTGPWLVSYSADGLTWFSGSDPRNSGAFQFRVVSGNNILLGVIPGTDLNPFSSSTDGITFNSFPANSYLSSGFLALTPVTFGKGLFVNSSLQASQDGTNWSSSAISPTNGGYFVQEMITNATGYVAIASPLLISSNGFGFSVTTNALPAYPGRVCSAAGLYHGAAGSAIVRSTNGLDWELRNSATTQNLNDIEFGNSLWIAVGNNGTITASTTGNAWSLRTSGTAVALNGITVVSNLFIVVGQSGTVLTSTDANSWSPQYSGTLETLNKIAFGDGQFVAVGQHGIIVTSPDGTNWATSVSGTTTSTLSGISFGDGAFCAVGSGSVLTSTDGTAWQPRKVESASQISGVRFFNGTFFVFGGPNILQSGPVISPQLQAGWSNGFPQLSIHATADLLLRMESSEDLNASQWTDCGLISVSPAGDFNYQDSNHVQSARFYRVVAP